MTVIESAIQKLRSAPLGGETINPSLTLQELEALICAGELMVAVTRAVKVGAMIVMPKLSEAEIAAFREAWERENR